jgi:hypothetical protein
MRYNEVLKLASKSYVKKEKQPTKPKEPEPVEPVKEPTVEGVKNFDVSGVHIPEGVVPKIGNVKPRAKRSSVPKKTQQKILENENKLLKMEALLKANNIQFEE